MKELRKPQIRFAGFTDDWEQRKLGDCKDVRDGTHNSPKYYQTGYPLVTSKNLSENGLDLSDVSFISEQDYNEINKRSKVDVGDILLGLIGTIGNPVQVQKDGYAIKNVGLIKNSGNVCNKFLLQLFKSSLFTQYIEQKNTGNTQKFLGLETLRNYEFYCPTIEEQTAIGNFFKQLDETIALHQREYEKYKNLKISYLEKMFPKENEQFPELRFPEFTDAWEQRKLGEIVEIIGGGTPDTTNENYWNGSIDWYSPTEIGNNVYAIKSEKTITKLGLEKSSAKLLPANKTILFTSRASIGDMAILKNQGSTNQGFQSFVVGENLDIYFLYSMGYKIKEFALKNASGSTFLEISKNQLALCPISLPSKQEQTAIGNFFKQLDETIALHQRELEKYKKIKQSYLEKMFV